MANSTKSTKGNKTRRQRTTTKAQVDTPARARTSRTRRQLTYLVDIFVVGDDSGPRTSFEASDTLLPLVPGHRLSPSVFGDGEPADAVYYVRDVEHEIDVATGTTRRVRVFASCERHETSQPTDTSPSSLSGWSSLRTSLDGWGYAKLAEYWPKLEAVWEDKIAPTVRGQLTDDRTMSRAFRALYQAIPVPGRLVISEDTFVQWGLRNRDWFFADGEEDARGRSQASAR